MGGFVLNRILVVGDRAAGRRILGKELAAAGFVVFYAKDDVEALDCLDVEAPDLLVTEHRPSSLDAIDLVRRVRAVSGIPVVVISAFGSIADCERAMRMGADRFLQFRTDLNRLGAVAQELVEGATSARTVDLPLTASQARELGQKEFRHRLERLVVECRGNIAEIGRRMERDRSTVRYHLRRLGLLDRTSPRGSRVSPGDIVASPDAASEGSPSPTNGGLPSEADEPDRAKAATIRVERSAQDQQTAIRRGPS